MDEKIEKVIKYDNKKLGLLIVLTIAIVARVFYFAQFSENPHSNKVLTEDRFDERFYYEGAQMVAKGDLMAVTENDTFSPFYKYFLGLIFFVTNNNLYAVWTVQFLLGVIAAILIYLCSYRLYGFWPAIFGGVFYGTYGPSIFHEGLMLRASLTAFLGILSLYLLTLMLEKRTWQTAAFAGLASSFMVQCRPNMALPLLLVLLYLFLSKKIDWQGTKKKVLTAFMIVLVVIGIPILIRSSYVHKRFVFYDAGDARVFVLGNLPDYEGVGWSNSPLLEKYSHDNNDPVVSKVGPSIKFLLSEMAKDPAGFLWVILKKTYYTFNSYEPSIAQSIYIYEKNGFLTMTPWSKMGFLSAVSIAGLILCLREKRKQIILPFLFLMGSLLSVIIVYPLSRFRIPVIPFMTIFAGVGLFIPIKMMAEHTSEKIAQGLGVILAIAVLSLVFMNKGDYDSDIIKYNPYQESYLALAYMRSETHKNYDKAEEILINSWIELQKTDSQLKILESVCELFYKRLTDEGDASLNRAKEFVPVVEAVFKFNIENKTEKIEEIRQNYLGKYLMQIYKVMLEKIPEDNVEELNKAIEHIRRFFPDFKSD